MKLMTSVLTINNIIASAIVMSQFEENNIVFEIKQPTPDDLREPSTYCVVWETLAT